MPVAVEQVDSRAYDSRIVVQDNRFVRSAQIIVNYLVYGTDEPAWAAQYTPADGSARVFGNTVAFVIAKAGKVVKVGGSENGVCQVSVTYGPKEKLAQQTGDEDEYELDLGTETAHVQEALSQSHYPAGAGDEVGNRIGLTNDGQIQGVDIVTPKTGYREIRYYDNVTSQQLAAWEGLVGYVNAQAWRVWQMGEVRFDGVSLRRRGQGKWVATFNFAISRDATVEKQIEGEQGSTQIDKGGWEYLWYRWLQKKDQAGTALEAGVRSAHVAIVYPSGDFTQLGLG
jgi:hypothetical protein